MNMRRNEREKEKVQALNAFKDEGKCEIHHMEQGILNIASFEGAPYCIGFYFKSVKKYC